MMGNIKTLSLDLETYSSYDLKSKRGIIELNGKEEKTRTHTIAF